MQLDWKKENSNQYENKDQDFKINQAARDDRVHERRPLKSVLQNTLSFCKFSVTYNEIVREPPEDDELQIGRRFWQID